MLSLPHVAPPAAGTHRFDGCLQVQAFRPDECQQQGPVVVLEIDQPAILTGFLKPVQRLPADVLFFEQLKKCDRKIIEGAPKIYAPGHDPRENLIDA